MELSPSSSSLAGGDLQALGGGGVSKKGCLSFLLSFHLQLKSIIFKSLLLDCI